MNAAHAAGGGAGLLRRGIQVLLFYALLAWLGAMLLLGNVACLPLALLPARRRRPLMQQAISATFRLFLGGARACGLMCLDLTALDAIDAEPGGLVLVANHPSMIDVFLVISRVRRAQCLMKASLSANAFLAVGAALAGYIANRRTDAMLRAAAREAAAGGRILVFPEGTRSRRQPLGCVKPGAGLIAARAGVPLQTIVLRTNSPYLGKGWPIWRPPQFPLLYQARLGPKLQPAASAAATARALQAQFERELTLSIDPSLRF